MARWYGDDVSAADHDRWTVLYTGYATFYETTPALGTVWGWLTDPAHPVNGLVVRSAPGAPAAGLAHYRPFARPLAGTTGCYLDDLFVDPAVRGGGAARALLAELSTRAMANGWDVVRWITRSSNSRARRLYDDVATATAYVTYDMKPR